MRIGVIVLPILPWPTAQPLYARLEGMGFDTIWFYDHLVWRAFSEEPWQATVPLMTAVAATTSRVRLGTIVASANYRHPVTFAKELMTLDDVSGGRITLGVGAGAVSGWDTTALGQEPWSTRERTERFEELVEHLDVLLTQPRTAELRGRHYAALEARNLPGCRQLPRLPFWIAATGPRGLRLAARHGEGWITLGHPRWPDELTAAERDRELREQIARMDGACREVGRDPRSLERLYMSTPTREHWWASVAAFRDHIDRFEALGFTDVALHYPHPHPPFDVDTIERFEAVVGEVLASRPGAPPA